MTLTIYFTKKNFSIREKKEMEIKGNKKIILIPSSYDIFIDGTNTLRLKFIIRLVLKSIINLIFYPPYINHIFYSSSNTIFYLTPLNTFFLFFNTFKFYNIYRSIFYFLPISGALGEIQCKKYSIKLNIEYMFRTLYEKFHVFFPCIIFTILLFIFSIMIHGSEKFTVDLKAKENIFKNKDNFKGIHSDEFRHLGSFVDDIWINISSLISVIFHDYFLSSPFSKVLMLISKIMGNCCLYMIYYKVNIMILLSDKDTKAYSKLEKLFKPENKEYKASDVIKSLLLAKRAIMDNNENTRYYRGIIVYKKEENNLEKNPIYHKKKIRFLKIKFIFLTKLYTDVLNFVDLYKISRNFSLPIDTMFQTMEETMFDNMNSLTIKLGNLNLLDKSLKRIKKRNDGLIKKIDKIRKYEDSLITHLFKYYNEINVKMAIKNLHRTIARNKPNQINNIKRTKSVYLQNKSKVFTSGK